MFRFDEYRLEHDRPPVDLSSFSDAPWAPFASRDDFELAKIFLEAGLSRTHINSLLSHISKAKAGKSKVSFSSYSDVEKVWEMGSLDHAEVRHFSSY